MKDDLFWHFIAFVVVVVVELLFVVIINPTERAVTPRAYQSNG